MSRSARIQLFVACIAGVIAAGAIAWMLEHRGSTVPSMPTGPLPPPRLAELKAVSGSTSRKLNTSDTYTVVESLDFQVEVDELCFLYVVTHFLGQTTVQWQPEASEPWDRGVYAPNWSDDKAEGLRFASPGDMDLFLIASPLPIKDIDTWTPAQLAAPKERCPRCAVNVTRFKILGPPMQLADDAGTL